MRFLFTCGGTAGHINPAIAIAGRLRELMPEAEFLFVGSGRMMENKLIPQAGFKLQNIKITGFERGLRPSQIVDNLKTVKNLALSFHACTKILKAFKPDVVVGTGGYVCYPVLRRASLMGIPTVLHESNAIPGLTTKMLCKHVDKMLVAFPDVADAYSRPEKVLMTGTPVRGEFFRYSRETARAELGFSEKPLVVSFWGSLGAEEMNEKMADFIAMNAQEQLFEHIHAAGGYDADMQKIKEALYKRDVVAEHVPLLHLRPYIDDMPRVMAAADVILCRAGASTIAELLAMGKASVLVPSPNVTNNHQEKNALQVEKAGAGRMLRESECTGERLFEVVKEMLTDSGKLRETEENACRIGMKDATEQIVEHVLELVK